MHVKARKKNLVRSVELALVALTAQQLAVAQTAPAQQPERIVITGSNIKRLDAETAEPILKITREEIANSGKATLTEYLQSLTLDGQGSLPTGFGNGFAAGATAISLRGLGANATLVLLNGRRLAPYPRADDFQKMFADLSSVPLEAVERIEVLKDGASAIYGSDALAGVVNIILRNNFNGVVAKAEAGQSRYSDGKRAKGALTMGAGDLSSDKWNVLLNIEASKVDEIHYRDRDRKYIGKGDLTAYGYDSLGSQWTPGSLVNNVASASPAGYVRNPANNIYQLISPCTAALPGVVLPKIAGDSGCSYDIGKFRSFQPKLESFSIFGRGAIAINENWEAYAELSYGKNKTGFDVSPLGAPGTINGPYGTRAYGTGINVPELRLAANHPDNPFGAPARFRYNFAEFGAQRRTNDVDITRVMVGAKGTVAGWDLDAGISHSESKLDQAYDLLSIQGLITAFASTTTPTLGYYRMGANAGLNSQALRDSILVKSTGANKTELDIFDIKASRELMKLDGGALALALGAEYRKMKLSAPSLSGTDTGAVQASYSGFFGDEKVTAAYAEVLAPIVKGFELSGAVRYDKYDSFSSTTPKVAAKFTPLPELALRASYAHGFRAPNVAESSPNAQATFGTAGIYDPVRCTGLGAPKPGAVAADCNGSGVAGLSRGNPDLKPEKSRNFNLGFIAEPLRGLNFGADFWRITKKDQIQTITSQEAFFRPDVIRSDNNLAGIPNSGTALVIFAPFVNKGESKVSGVDFDLGYRWNIQDGRMKADLHWTRVSKFEVIDGADKVDYAGTHGNCDVSNCIGSPKDKVNASLSWDTASFGVTTTVNWRSSMRNIASKQDETCLQDLADGTPANGCKLPSFYTFDLTGRWNVTKQLQIYGSIQNVFDKVAPLDTVTYGGINYNPMDASGAMGRFFNIGLKYTF